MEARVKQQTRDETYRIYVTDTLQAIADNTAHYVGFDGLVDCGVHQTKRYVEMFDEEPEEEQEDTRSQDEIIDDIWAGIRGKKKRGDK